MDLIIVESPTKARTLTRYLKGKFQVMATMGHIRDLPKSDLGVDVEHDFLPRYIVPRDKSAHVKELKVAAAKADNVILATDPDREGEAIAWHVAAILNEAKKTKKKKTDPSDSSVAPISPVREFKRIAFHEITEHAINEALGHPRTVDTRLVDAQQARRVMDRLVGYKLSPLLWQKLSKRWLSAGRVQSVAVRLIVEREREITRFTKKEFWTIEGDFAPNIVSQLVSKNGVKYEAVLTFDLFDGKYTTKSTSIENEAAAHAIVADLAPPFTVSAVDKKEIRRNPAAPFTTSTLQQDAGRRLYFSAKKTMQIAQKLYEEGYISYHRTDSVNLSEKFLDESRAYIAATYGKEFVNDTPRKFQTKSKVAQEAHEAIRPTNVTLLAAAIDNGDLNRDHHRLYELIWKRAVASQAKEAVFDSTTIEVSSANGYVFGAQGSVIKFEGFLKIMGRDTEEVVIPDVKVGQTVALTLAKPEQHFTSPPPRYTEASLIKTLEEKDIGRPSTYAPIISTIQDRQYVTREEKKLVPTDLGNSVTDFLVQYFPDVLELPFTAKMEHQLDAIANGEMEWVPVIREFYAPFEKDLNNAYDQAEKVKVAEEVIDEKCSLCSNPLVIRMGRYGKFVACSTFPACKYTRQFSEKIDMKCPRDGGDIVIKKTRRGKTFYGCSNYPTCTFAAWKKEDIK